MSMFLNVLYAKKIDTTKIFVQGKVAIMKISDRLLFQ